MPKVSFNTTITIIIIPNKYELDKDHIWWNRNDIKNIRQDYIYELDIISNKYALSYHEAKLYLHNYNKKVSFDDNITYIYNFNMYEELDLLWYSKRNLINAKYNALKDINELLNKHTNMTIPQARKLLYQPNNITIYDPSNFD